MKKALVAAAALIAVAAPMTIPTAMAQSHRDRDHRWDGDRDGRWDPSEHYDNKRYKARKLSRDDRIYRGSDGRYYCKRNNGTTGLVIGGVAGGVLGNVVGGGTLGTLLGAGGGALLGRELDRGKVKCR